MSRAVAILGGILLASIGLGLPAQAAGEEATATVTYVTGSSVYLDAGRSAGLAVGTRLELTRDGEPVATVEVQEISGARAVAKVVSEQRPPQVGDTARFAAVTIEPDRPASQGAPEEKPKKRRGPSGIHGRVGVRYIVVDDDVNPDGGYSQPAFDLRVDGTRMGATPWGFDVDVRSRRTYRNEPGAADVSSTRAYRFLVSRGRNEDGWRFSLGRQLSPHLAALSIFDGFAADYDAERWGAGMVTGTQPDPVDYGFSSDVTEHGFYFRFNGARPTGPQWNLVTGAIGSYDGGDVDREFVYVLGRYRTKRFWAYAAQEIDFNRDWKVDEAGEDSVQPTSTFLSFSFRPNRTVTLRGGYDNRRNVRLARDRVTPVTEFDDEFRRGAWVGATFRIANRYVAGVDTRVNNGGSAGSSSNHSATFSGRGFTSRNLGFRSRVARYSNDFIEGWLYELDGGMDLGEAARLRARVGRRDDTLLTSIPPEETLDWFGLSLDVLLGRRWYGTLESEVTEGDLDKTTQHYVTLTYRF